MTFDPVEFFKSLSDAQKRSCVLALELARHKLDGKQYDDVRDKGHKRIELIRECFTGQHEKATLNEARLLLLLLRDLTFNILESDFRNQKEWLACRKANMELINSLEAAKIRPR